MHEKNRDEWDEEFNTFFRFLRKQLELRGHSMASVARALGKSRAWMQRILAGNRPLSDRHLKAILREIGVSFEEMCALYLEEVSSPQPVLKSDLAQNPALLLRAVRGKNDPDLDWIGDFEGISATPLPRNAHFPLHPRVRRIDDAREYDRQAALVEAEDWLHSLRAHGEERRLSPQKTSHLCTALGAWASIQRTLGRQALGAKTLEMAWQLHGHAPSAPSWGDLLERTATAVYEFGYPLAGYPLIQQAFAIAAETRDSYRESRCLLGMGTLAFFSGQSKVARSHFRRAGAHPGSDALRRAGAVSYLALDLEKRGLIGEAAVELEGIADILPDLPVGHQLSLLGQRANILADLGDLEAARAIYEEILRRCRPHFSPINRAVALLYLVDILLRLDRPDLVRHHRTSIRELMVELDDTPVAQDILSTLETALQEGGSLDGKAIIELRRQLKEAIAAMSS